MNIAKKRQSQGKDSVPQSQQPGNDAQLQPEGAGTKGKTPWYKRWYVWVIVVLVLCIIWPSGGDDGNDETSDDGTTVETTSEDTSEATREDTSETTSEDTSEEITTIAGTDASEYLEIVIGVMTEKDDPEVPEATVEDGVATYETATDCHTLEVVADVESDEIVSVTLDTLAYSDDVGTYNLMTAAINNSGAEGLEVSEALDFLLGFYGGDANDKEVSGEISSSLGTDTVLYTLEANESSLPKLTITAAGQE